MGRTCACNCVMSDLFSFPAVMLSMYFFYISCTGFCMYNWLLHIFGGKYAWSILLTLSFTRLSRCALFMQFPFPFASDGSNMPRPGLFQSCPSLRYFLLPWAFDLRPYWLKSTQFIHLYASCHGAWGSKTKSSLLKRERERENCFLSSHLNVVCFSALH